MAEEKSGLLIVAMIAIVAIVGLILLFNGSITGSATSVHQSTTPCSDVDVPIACSVGKFIIHPIGEKLCGKQSTTGPSLPEGWHCYQSTTSATGWCAGACVGSSHDKDSTPR